MMADNAFQELRVGFTAAVSHELRTPLARLLALLESASLPGTDTNELLQKLWGRRETHRDRTVDVFVRRLREKVDRRAPRHTFIQTRYGVGYKLQAEPKP